MSGPALAGYVLAPAVWIGGVGWIGAVPMPVQSPECSG